MKPSLDYLLMSLIVIAIIAVAEWACGQDRYILLEGRNQYDMFGQDRKSQAVNNASDTPAKWRKSQKSQIVLFTGEWCSVCRKWEREQRTRMEHAGWRFGDANSITAHVRVVDESNNEDLAKAFAITSYPTFLITKGDKVLSRIRGYATAEQLNEAIRQKPDASKQFDYSGRQTDKTTTRKTALCKCEGYKHAVCMCLAEIRSGVRPLSKPCGCSKSKASEHYIDKHGKPVGATGRYIKIKAATTVLPIKRRKIRYQYARC